MRIVTCRWRRAQVVAVFALAAAAFASAAADKKPEDSTKRVAAGKSASAKATILRREGGVGKEWHAVDEKETLYTGDLLIGLPGAALDSADGAVHLEFLSDLDELSPFPVKENAVVLGSNADFDLEFTLDRGRVDMVNTKKKGEAKVRFHVRDAVWDVTLAEPGATVACELFGRWPRGVRFTRKPGPRDVPTASLLILAVKGESSVKHEGCECAMAAPPGPALIEWDSVHGQDKSPQRLETLPEWAVSGKEDTPKAREKKAILEKLRQMLATKSTGEILDELLASDDEKIRRMAIIAAGALDDLERLGKALRETKHLDVWENGVLTLRHWIGRCPGQDQILYQRLLEKGKFTPVQAETIMDLLHSFGDDDLARPETYQTLIDYLDHDQLAIRGLAYWHLHRLVPAGKEFGYNPNSSKEERDQAIAKWRKLVPVGTVPAKPKPMEKK
jgi:hypothetical protein